jgi:trehalose/maltose transport system permease protein
MATNDGGLSLLQQRQRAAFWFIAPMLLALFCVAAWPLLRTIWFSLTDTKLSDLYGGAWIGFDNYLSLRVLDSGRWIWRGTLVDPDWWNAVWNTVRFAFVSVFFETVLGLIVALVLNAEFKGRGLVRAAILIPWAIPTIVSAKMWAWMLNDQFGILNDIALNLGLISQKIAWTASVDTAMYAVLMVDVWKTTPFMALLILAGPADGAARHLRGGEAGRDQPGEGVLQDHPAADPPGAGRGDHLPDAGCAAHLRPVYVLTPNSAATKTMSVISRENMIDFDKFAYGAAQSTLLFAIIAIFVSLYIWLGKVDLSGEGQK